ncbi:MAG: hypothetical protein K940chlam3_01330 [Chlamydiae bacterium]|nr:hypothetical protein [Chlamydiota bacterium]
MNIKVDTLSYYENLINDVPEQRKELIGLMRGYIVKNLSDDPEKEINGIRDHLNGYSLMHQIAKKEMIIALFILQEFGGDMLRKSPMNDLTPREILEKYQPEKYTKYCTYELKLTEKAFNDRLKKEKERLESLKEELEKFEKIKKAAQVLAGFELLKELI